MLDRATVDHIAELAKIALTDAERELMREELSRILDYVEQVRAVPIGETADRAAPAAAGRLRADEARPGLPRAALLALAPAEEAGHVTVPPLLD